ncbi:MAG: hypothetical protein ACK48W_03100 [Bacteroidota bacterium]
MKSKTTKNTKSLLLGLFLAVGLLMFGKSQAAEHEGIKVSKQFVDEITKIDPSYKKLIKADANGIFIDYNDPTTTKLLLEKDAANKKTKEVNKTSGKVEIAPTAATKNAKSAPAFSSSKPSKKEIVAPIKDKNTLGDVEARKHLEKRIEFEKAKLNSVKGEDLIRLRKSITELEKMRLETFNTKN